MIDWKNKPIEITNLINPAFCSLILYEAIKSYEKKSQKGMPFATTYLVLPMILSQPIITRLPKSTNARLDIWLKDNIELKYVFIKNAKNLKKYTKEALFFSLNHDIISFTTKGRLEYGKLRRPSSIKNDQELSPKIKKAQFLGRWFSKIDDPVILYSLLGIRP